ncbi:hypothetical protein CHARACLAT_019859 [Characodon lateralis]|uniref:EH domain-containing protein n=1 Tax=Characodon lateralis TaxID=208331 RepID=A0ABU7DUU3_9TELE|nr:hypothetical protein [Characodon lateralis]
MDISPSTSWPSVCSTSSFCMHSNLPGLVYIVCETIRVLLAAIMKGTVSICCLLTLLFLQATAEVEEFDPVLRDRSHIDETLRLATEEKAADYAAAIQKLRKIYHSSIKPMEQAYKYNELRQHEISAYPGRTLGDSATGGFGQGLPVHGTA